MAKKNKLATPDWITEGFDSKADWEKAHGVKSAKKMQGTKSPTSSQNNFVTKGKTFKIRECPECGSDDVGVVLSNSDSEDASNTGKNWECRKCKAEFSKPEAKELTEDEFMEYLDNKGEEVA